MALTQNYSVHNYIEYNLGVGCILRAFVANWALGELLLNLTATG